VNYDGFILAGGRGLRLAPLTDTTPKPLLKVKGRPMLDWILRRYKDAGFTRVWIATRYLASKISDRYGHEFDGVKLEYLVEKDELGTAGSLALLPEPLPLCVSNGDLFTDLDFAALTKFHEAQAADATVCAAPRVLPYGVCHTHAQDVIVERPTIWTNAGMYVLEKHVVRGVLMGSAHKQTMPDIINRIAHFGGKVAVYDMAVERWLDIGTPADYEKANA
jgi:NDP-sugar pyrophosphorylase family protein